MLRFAGAALSSWLSMQAEEREHKILENTRKKQCYMLQYELGSLPYH